jgi:hypothetical protein
MPRQRTIFYHSRGWSPVLGAAELRFGGMPGLLGLGQFNDRENLHLLQTYID